jgi:hypothetical protein
MSWETKRSIALTLLDSLDMLSSIFSLKREEEPDEAHLI